MSLLKQFARIHSTTCIALKLVNISRCFVSSLLWGKDFLFHLGVRESGDRWHVTHWPSHVTGLTGEKRHSAAPFETARTAGFWPPLRVGSCDPDESLGAAHQATCHSLRGSSLSTVELPVTRHTFFLSGFGRYLGDCSSHKNLTTPTAGTWYATRTWGQGSLTFRNLASYI